MTKPDALEALAQECEARANSAERDGYSDATGTLLRAAAALREAGRKEATILKRIEALEEKTPDINPEDLKQVP